MGEATSTFEEFAASSKFQPIYVDTFKEGGNTVILCSGRFYFDIKRIIEEAGASAKVIRVEQLAPFPEQLIK